MSGNTGRDSASQRDYSVALIYVYAILWTSLAIYVAAFATADDTIAVHVTAIVLLIAVLIHLLASTATSSTSSFASVVAVAALTLPTALLLFHRTDNAALYLAYVVLHATIAVYVVDAHIADSKLIPRSLAAAQVAYVVILLLDSLGRALPRLLYPAADLKFFDALHNLADIRLLLLFPIVVAWIVIAVLRCRRDGSFESLPVVWRTDISVHAALAQLPLRFAIAIGAFLAVVARRIGTDFLYSFRTHARYLLKYLATVSVVACMLLGARAFSPWLVKYLRTPTSPVRLVEPTQIALLTVAPVVGFMIFLLVPFLNATVASMWRPELSPQRLRQRAYQMSVYAAVPCAVIGPLFWLGAKWWFHLPGFSQFGLVSVVVVVTVAVMLLFGARGKILEASPSSDILEDTSSAARPRREWRRALPVALIGGVLVLMLVSTSYLGDVAGERWPGLLQPRIPSTPPPRPSLALRDVQLSEGQEVSNQLVSRESWRYYWIDVPAGAHKAVVNVRGVSAGGGTYVYTAMGVKPRNDSYLCRAVVGPSGSPCVHEKPSSGKLWIALQGGSTANQVTLRAEITYSIQGNAGAADASIAVISNGQRVAATTSATNGSYIIPDLRAGVYAITLAKLDCTFGPSSKDIVLGPSLESVNFTVQCPYSELVNGVALNGESVGYRQWRYYVIEVPEGRQMLRFSVSANADIDLYTNFNAAPSSTRRLCQKSGPSSSERCEHRGPGAGRWWAGVYGYSATTYQVTAVFE